MSYGLKIWVSLNLGWAWKLFGYCGHIDTCRQTKFRSSCTRYEVLHIEEDWNRTINLFVSE